MEPEKLKVIAEGMGYRIHTYQNKILIDVGDSDWVPINPLANNDQMIEILERLLELGWTISKFEDKYLLTLEVVCNISTQFTGKTINEAVCNTTYEYFNGIE